MKENRKDWMCGPECPAYGEAGLVCKNEAEAEQEFETEENND
jgi:hypothetical protein